MLSLEEMRKETPVLVGQLDILERAQSAIDDNIATQKCGAFISFLEKYAHLFPQVVFGDSAERLSLVRLLGLGVFTDPRISRHLIFVQTSSTSVNISDVKSCAVGEDQIYRHIHDVHEIQNPLFREKLAGLVIACINSRLKDKGVVPEIMVPGGYVAFRFDTLWAAGGYDDDRPTVAEVIIKADDIQSGFDALKAGLLVGRWRGDKNFVGNIYVAIPAGVVRPNCRKWYPLPLTLSDHRGTRGVSGLISADFNLQDVALDEGFLCFYGKEASVN